MAAWADEITLISMKEGEERVNDNGFPNEEAEDRKSTRKTKWFSPPMRI